MFVVQKSRTIYEERKTTACKHLNYLKQLTIISWIAPLKKCKKKTTEKKIFLKTQHAVLLVCLFEDCNTYMTCTIYHDIRQTRNEEVKEEEKTYHNWCAFDCKTRQIKWIWQIEVSLHIHRHTDRHRHQQKQLRLHETTE